MKQRIVTLAVLGLALLAVCVATWTLAWRNGIDELQRSAALRAERTADTLKSTLDRYEYLPYLLSRHPFVQELLANPRNPANVTRANLYLADLNQHAHATVAYIIANSGVALASSNWDATDSFVGESYGFRPYFRDALRGSTGRFFGIGTVKGQPGYYISQPVYGPTGKVIGVTVIKLSLEWVQKAEDKSPLMVADDHGVIFLSSVPDWKYHTLRPLPKEVEAAIYNSRQYARQRMTALPRTVVQHLDDASQIERIGTGRDVPAYLATRRDLGDPDWQLLTLAALTPVEHAAAVATFAAACAFAFLCLLLMYWRQRRSRVRDMLKSRHLLQAAYAELEKRVAERTADLSRANHELSTQIQERIRAEQELRAAQSELVEAGKLAALGRMAAGITHELNQPLAALRSFSDNARVLLARGDYAVAGDNLEAIASLTERMGRITGQLKLFAGKVRPQACHASVGQALRNTLMVMHARLHAVTFETVSVDGGVRRPFETDANTISPWVRCDALRLEQVLINLLGNALDAVTGTAAPALAIEIEALSDVVRITVRDNGPGIARAALEHVFEPFFTTKEGQGLGLGLAISSSIAAEYGGTLAVAPDLPGVGPGAASQSQSHADADADADIDHDADARSGPVAYTGAAFVLTLPRAWTPVAAPARNLDHA